MHPTILLEEWGRVPLYVECFFNSSITSPTLKLHNNTPTIFQMSSLALTYRLITETNTQPRTYYQLAKSQNVNYLFHSFYKFKILQVVEYIYSFGLITIKKIAAEIIAQCHILGKGEKSFPPTILLFTF